MNRLEYAALLAGVGTEMFQASTRERGLAGAAVYFATHPLSSAKRIRYLAREALFDRQFSVATRTVERASELGLSPSKVEGVTVNSRGIGNSPTPAWMLTGILKRLGIHFREYSFVDLGSGRGRAVLQAIEFPFRQVVGVELAESLHEAAQSNLDHAPETCRRAQSVQLFCQDATEYPLPSGNLVIYLANPFREQPMRKFLGKLAERQKNPAGNLYLIYTQPMAGTGIEDWRPDLNREPYLKRLKAAKYYTIYQSSPPV